ncbi:MAG: hypothetical protein ISR77_07605 [Pirellulaceae bacterium]|nr:hypothetical protein [Pirellulaceae bacterium]
MNRTNLTILVFLASALFCSPARSGEQVPRPEQASRLLVLQLSEHFDPPDNPFIAKSFWTNARAIPHLYSSHTSVADTANVVAEQLKQIYDDHGAESDITSTPRAVQSLVYIPASSAAEEPKKNPISETALYKTIREKSAAGDFTAQWWVILVRDWHRIVFEEHKQQYRPALDEAVETIPMLADAIVKTRQAVEEESSKPPATSEPSKPGEPAKDPADAADEPKPSETPHQPADGKRTPEEALQELLSDKFEVVTGLIQELKTEIGDDDPAELKTIRNDFAQAIRGVLSGPDVTSVSAVELRRRMTQEIKSKVEVEYELDFSPEFRQRILFFISGIRENLPLGTGSKEDYVEFYTEIANRLAPPISEKELVKILGEKHVAIEKLIEAIEQAITKKDGDPKRVHEIKQAFAKRIREVLHETATSAEWSVAQVRTRMAQEVRKLSKNYAETEAPIANFMSNLHADSPIGSQTGEREDFEKFYTDIADTLDPITHKDSLSAAGLDHDKDSLEGLFADLKPEIFKFSKSTKELYKRNIQSFTDSLKEIIETQYAENQFTRMQEDTKAKANALIDDLKIIPNKRSRELWKRGYQDFVDWAEKKNGKTVEGWRKSLINLKKVLDDSVGIYDEWTARAEEHFRSMEASGSGSGTGTHSGSGGYATWAAVRWTRIMERRRAKYERNALRIQAIRGSR